MHIQDVDLTLLAFAFAWGCLVGAGIHALFVEFCYEDNVNEIDTDTQL